MSDLLSFSDIFERKIIYRIPDYQRGFAWQEPQLRDFWEDLINLNPDRYHYTGMISLRKMSDEESNNLCEDDTWLIKTKHYKPYHIVDGQQRFTTFIILLNEIIEYIKFLPEHKGKSEEEIYINGDSIRKIKEQYICEKCPPPGLIISYLFGYEKDNPSAKYLKHTILGQPYGGSIEETYYTKNLKNAKEFFSNELRHIYDHSGFEGLVKLYDKLTNNFMFNIHQIDDTYDVFIAFETMNNRGKRLTNLELLKNRLIYLTTLYPKSVLDKQNEISLRNRINEAWKEVYYQLGRNKDELLSDDEFLRAHWIIYYSYSRKKGDDYIRFLLRKFSHKSIFENVMLMNYDEKEENVIPDPGADDDEGVIPEPIEQISSSLLQPIDILNYVNSLEETAEFWYYTFFPDQCSMLDEEEKIWLDKLKRIGLGYFRPMITVSLIPRLGFSTDDRLALYKAIERFIFVNFRMAMYQSSYKSSDYYRKTRDLYYGAITISDITEDLNNTTNGSSKDSIRVFLTRMNRRFIAADGFYNWRDLRYFLYEYDFSLALKYKREKLSWAVLTKSVKDGTITVEHILPQTPTKLYWRNNFRQFTEKEIKLLSASLGNMLPLSQSINSSLQNDSFDEKKERGYENGCYSEIEVSKEQTWNAKSIYNRGIHLLEFMESRWQIRFESKEQMDELLHISFVNDGRVVPQEITEESFEKEMTRLKKNDPIAFLTTIVESWANNKTKSGEFKLCSETKKKEIIRFTTDAMSKIIPDAPLASSIWHTKNYYFYEIWLEAGKSLTMVLVLNSTNVPNDIRIICEKIIKLFSKQKYQSNWKYNYIYKSEPVKIIDSMSSDEISTILDEQYKQLMDFEKMMIEKIMVI